MNRCLISIIKRSIIVGLVLALIGSCQNKDIDIETFSIATEQVRSGIDTVGIIGSYDFFKEAEVMKINIGRDSTLADASSHAVLLMGKDYSVIVRNLQANTKYYYNYSVNVGVHNDFITPTKSFRTLQAQDFTIIVSAIPNEGGAASGGGTYTQGQQCTVTASAHEGYTFMHWTENDSVISTDSIYRFVVTGNRVLAAQFALLITEPTVTTGEVTDITQTSAKGNGEVTNDGGTAVTERGLCWSTSHNPTVLGNHATSGTGIGTFSVDMSGLTANTKYYVRAYATNSEGTAYGDEVEFTTSQLNNYTVSVSANPANGGTATGGGFFQQGQSCTVRASANTGYTFVNWTENGNQVSANANYTFTVNGNRTLVANFTVGSYIISATVDPENSGTITGAGGYEYGQSCTLKATANTGYTFEKWTENGTQVSTNATYTFSVSGSRSLLAHFKVNSYTITVSANPAAGGVATGGGTFEYGQSCTLSATANSGYNFSNWTEGGNVVSSNSSYTFTVTGNRTLKANFTQQAPQDYTISVSANPSDGGTVTGGGTYQQGQSCTVRATANSGYTFSKWTENGNQVSTSANYTFTVNSNRTLVAHFTANPQNYTITVSADPTNGGSVSGGGSYQQGQNCTVTAAANSGYTFSNWTENGNVVSSNTSYSFIVTGNRTLVAHFIANPQSYTITVSANPTNGGTVSGGGTYQQGQNCTVTATANSGFTFTNWTENGSQVSTNVSYSFTVNGNRSLVANFEQNTPSWPNGVLPGVFSVSATKQVKFSQGNLQYQASSNTWRFSDNQHQYCGTSNNNVSPTYSGWIDLFGWGTSGWNSGAECYQPWSISTNSSSYWPGGDPSSDLTGNYSNADWGVYNSISNGGGNANEWRLLTHEEWLYILLNRPDAAEKMSLGTVCNIHGLIILPDDFTIPQGIPFIGSSDNWNVNNYDESTWIVLQELGAVFLPACGMRQGASYGNSNIGVTYWSSTHSDGTYAYGIWIRSSSLFPHNNDVRWQGNAVRLVKEL